MLNFHRGSHGLDFWDQFSNDPAGFQAQVIAGIYYEVCVRRPERPIYSNEVGLAQLVQNYYGRWRFNPTFVEESLGPILTKAMRDYHLVFLKEREEADTNRCAFDERLRVGPPTPPVGHYFWHELRDCFHLNDSQRFRLWARSLGYFPWQ